MRAFALNEGGDTLLQPPIVHVKNTPLSRERQELRHSREMKLCECDLSSAKTCLTICYIHYIPPPLSLSLSLSLSLFLFLCVMLAGTMFAGRISLGKMFKKFSNHLYLVPYSRYDAEIKRI